ncbi:PREDICTED: putative nuclease HARBI1 [Erythranthe guttata]|uniref:putative nuclease HARBI1 n=1 Tax=Erythranthe guttata TaxID=4155 RepID=UPI00064DB6F4|nr:PREDICTED: putative nuclease HARBI1 [Erythranthe guttata]|eukprot:XP_012851102.1 PREDICTED: putative nuclease HARBI1 [Erythranthe guttata]
MVFATGASSGFEAQFLCDTLLFAVFPLTNNRFEEEDGSDEEPPFEVLKLSGDRHCGRMNIQSFYRLCYILENVGGLKENRNVSIPEQVAMFLQILAHHTKNVVVRSHFNRSGYTVSKHFNSVLLALLKLHEMLLITPKPVDELCENERFSHFKGCLGALDGTYIGCRVPYLDKPRYRNRKGNVSINVLAVCDDNMNFIYLLTGWEGSAADSRILRDAVTRDNGLRVPTGNYYLVDNGYTNGEGFLAPYRGCRYHLDAYANGPTAPRNFREFFNMKHAKARNIIERAFGLLKSRWAILRSPAYYPIKVQNRIVMACCLLHNFIRTTNDFDPEEETLDEFLRKNPGIINGEDYINTVETSEEWTN